ncbi:uncharacterized protein LOC141610565 [Silene latifolia]|uniref:uncharacterized protein LOC141610565 n=1 Tax=Silene latifolia TaxID=37657 RepID=UPI003D77B0BE
MRKNNNGDAMGSDTRFYLCHINCSSFSSFKFHMLLAHVSHKGMHSLLLQDYCLPQSTTENKYLSTHSISNDLDMGILDEAMKTYSYQNGFRKTMIQTQKFDKMLERQISNVLNLAIDASITEELNFPTPKVLRIAKASNSDSVPIELPNFEEKENIKNEENKPKKVVTFPDHLILDQILPRLPVKSLLRFKSVCRDWRSTISTPEFEKSRLAFCGSHHQFVLLKDDGRFSPSIINNPDYLIVRESCKYNDKDYLRIIGCCKGLVGLSTKRSRGGCNFLVLNPSTRQRVEILAPDGEYFISRLSWFGYVASVDDYYIVAFYSLGDEFWTYSWKAGIWKRNTCILNRNARGIDKILVGNPALINDSLYWPIDIWDPFHHVNTSTEIVEINLVTEKYEIKPRMNFWDGHLRCISLVNLEGFLALHTTCNRGRLEVLMLRQAGDWNSWEIVYSQVLRHCRLIYYSTTGKLLVGHSKQLKSVEDLNQLQPEEQESDGPREIRANTFSLESSGVGDYVESMIWPFRRSRPSIMHRCKQAITLAVLKITRQ